MVRQTDGYALPAALIGVPVVVIARAAWQVAPIVLAVPNIKVEHRRRCWRWVYRAVRHRLCPGLCRDRSANERDCAVRRRPYAKRDGCSRCNQMFAHFSKLLMFRLIWIASTRPLYWCCCDWFAIAPIWNGRQKSGWFSAPPLGLVPFSAG